VIVDALAAFSVPVFTALVIIGLAWLIVREMFTQ
jgi:hypothetical protein